MHRENIIHIVAGTLITTGAILGWGIDSRWLIIDLFVGINLFQYGFSNWCPLKTILRKFDLGEE